MKKPVSFEGPRDYRVVILRLYSILNQFSLDTYGFRRVVLAKDPNGRYLNIPDAVGKRCYILQSSTNPLLIITLLG